MKQQQKNTALAFAILAGLASLPLTWMTIRRAQIEGGFGEMFHSAFARMTLNVTGLNGSMTFIFTTPIWFIVTVAITANVLQLMRNSTMFAIPRWAEWLAAVVAVAWVGVAVLFALFSSKATLGIGLLLGLVCAGVPLVCLIIPLVTQEAASDSNAPDA